MSKAYLLISHGSRDPRPQQAMEKLANLVRAQLGTQNWELGGAGGFEYRGSLSSPNPRVCFVSRFLTNHRGTENREERIKRGRGEIEGVFGSQGSLQAGFSQGLLLGTADCSFQGNRFLPQVESQQARARDTTVVSSFSYPLVGTATLELGDAPLHEQIQEFVTLAVAQGCNYIQLLPLFLLPGVHVREDIPHEVALAQEGDGAGVVLKLQPHLGAHPGLGKLLASQWTMVEADAKILLAHGSRRVGGNEPVEAIAQELGAVAAYWSVSPSLEEQIQVLVAAGHKRIGILPYFLFPGGITDAIAQSLDILQAKFPGVQLSLGDVIGASAKLANLIWDLTEQ